METKELLRIYKFIKNGDKKEDIKERLELTEIEFQGLLEQFNLESKSIEIEINENGEEILKKTRTYQKNNKAKEEIEELIKTEICVVSDTHICSKKQQLTLLNKIYKETKNRCITTVLHVGDLVDGDYHNVRPQHLYEVFRHGYTEQKNYVVEMYPKVEGITTYFITGSHDDTHRKNGGSFFGEEVARERKDMIFLGEDEGDITINSIKIKLKHPGGGSSKYLSYKAQTIVDAIESGDKPNILLIGHYHKSYYMLYRNIHTFLVPCMVDETQFMKMNSMANIVGAYFLEIYANKKGEIKYIIPEEFRYEPEEMIENDYQRCRKLSI